MKDLAQQLEQVQGLSAKSVTQLNSTYKDLLAAIRFHESLGSLVQMCFSFMAKTLENHSKS